MLHGRPRSWPTATTPSTWARASTTTWSTSSPRPRSSPWSWRVPSAVQVVRGMMGATEPAGGGTGHRPRRLRPGHAARTWSTASDSLESAEREIGHLLPRGPRRLVTACGRARRPQPDCRRGPSRPFPPDFRLFLASQSPRRHSLLRDVGVPFSVVASAAEEITGGEAPAAALADGTRGAKVHAARPARRTRPAARSCWAPTRWWSVDDQVMGKPADRAEAAGDARGSVRADAPGGLRRGARAPGRRRSRPRRSPRGAAVTTCGRWPRWLDDGRSTAYVASGEWRDKAGAYAVQGLAALVRLRGSRGVQQRGGSAAVPAGPPVPRAGLRPPAAGWQWRLTGAVRRELRAAVSRSAAWRLAGIIRGRPRPRRDSATPTGRMHHSLH